MRKPMLALLGLNLLVLPSCAVGRAPGVSPYKVAFTGDTGYDAADTPEIDSGFERVLQLVKSEGAELLAIAGDFGYEEEVDVAATYFSNVDRVLGASFPVIAAKGNHDDWAHYRPFLQRRLERMGIRDDSISGLDFGLRYRGIRWAVVGDRPNANFVTSRFADDDHSEWRVCLWHKNMRDMQAGGKRDEMDWATYRACQDAGAIIATGHEHSYSRTLTLTDLGNRPARHGATGDPKSVEVAPGRTFVFVSGLGGRPDERDFECELHDGANWWATVYTSNYYLRNGEEVVKSCTVARSVDEPPLVKGYTHGVLFITFNAGGDRNRAEAYFKNVDGEVVDSFTIVRGSNR